MSAISPTRKTTLGWVLLVVGLAVLFATDYSVRAFRDGITQGGLPQWAFAVPVAVLGTMFLVLVFQGSAGLSRPRRILMVFVQAVVGLSVAAYAGYLYLCSVGYPCS